MKYLLLASFLFVFGPATSQDTLRAMVYNLLNYGNNSGFCNSTNNPIADKDEYLKTIIRYSKPDILGVNEMGSNVVYAERILQNTLNIDSIDYFKKATYSNQALSSIVNMLFYDSRRLELYNEIVVPATVRDINIYTFFYKDNMLSSGADTTFLTVVLAHLKAGNSTADANTRDNMVQSTMSTLKNNDLFGNVIFMGDFNVYRSSEPGYQRMVNENNPKYRFIDPINRPGSWNNSSGFADIHTQSTHTSGGCKSGGGMDDRFDQILSTTYALNDSSGIEYIQGSYTALGQDGNRFNGSLINPQNNSAPDSIIQALYEMSDHLPVYLDLRVNASWEPLGIEAEHPSANFGLSEGVLFNKSEEEVQYHIYNLRGVIMASGTINPMESLEIPFAQLKGSISILRMSESKSEIIRSYKILNR